MAKLTIVFGILLIILGVTGYVYTGSAHPTALIPAAAGILFIIFGALASSDNAKKRMLWMHISVTVALLLFLMPHPCRYRRHPPQPRRLLPLSCRDYRKVGDVAAQPAVCAACAFGPLLPRGVKEP